jgi:glutaminyl-peptide cyclotransferase
VRGGTRTFSLGTVVCLLVLLVACNGKPFYLATSRVEQDPQQAAKAPTPPFMSTVATLPPQAPDDDTPPPEKTDGFDGKRAFAQVAKQVSFGPRPSGSPAIAQLQNYIQSELSSYGCKVDTDSFTADTPIGRLPMKNIVAKIPGETSGIIMLATHYDTARSARDPNTGEVHPMPTFVGADDGGSSTGVMLELARLLCTKRQRYAVWITFFDGEEAMVDWSATDSCYGSRQMAAKMSMSGELSKVKAFLLADIVGTRNLRFRRDQASAPALVDLVWKTAAKLGYSQVFVNDTTSMEDDHNAFAKRGVSVLDVIDYETSPGGNLYYWHTPQDTLDKISSKSLAITGHVFLESVKQLQAK